MSTEKKKQGFASLTPERLQELSSKGGKKNVPKGFATLSEEEKRNNSARAAQIRWARVRAERQEQKTAPIVEGELNQR